MRDFVLMNSRIFNFSMISMTVKTHYEKGEIFIDSTHWEMFIENQLKSIFKLIKIIDRKYYLNTVFFNTSGVEQIIRLRKYLEYFLNFPSIYSYLLKIHSNSRTFHLIWFRSVIKWQIAPKQEDMLITVHSRPWWGLWEYYSFGVNECELIFVNGQMNL